jgi:acyl-CoA thioesterase I
MKINRKKALIVAVPMLILIASLAVVFFGNFGQTSPKTTRVALIGDSITQLSDYPEDLQAMLGSHYEVGNFGVNASTVIFTSTRPYYFEPAFKEARNFNPDILVIMLGTNDARDNVYGSIDRFVSDYEKLLGKIQALENVPKIYIVIPPPIYNNTIDLNSEHFIEGVLPRIEQVVTENNLPVIDVYSPLLNHPEFFPDGAHPNVDGANLIASIIYKAISQGSGS